MEIFRATEDEPATCEECGKEMTSGLGVYLGGEWSASVQEDLAKDPDASCGVNEGALVCAPCVRRALLALDSSDPASAV